MSEQKITTKDVLKTIAIVGGVGGLVVASAVMPGLPMALSYVIKAWKNVKRQDLGMIIKRLEKQEMLSIRNNNGSTIVEITDKGKRRLVEYDFENIELKKKKRDGKWRLIIFDIPEPFKTSRDAFRRKLLQLGFVRLQYSVFVSAYPCKNEIDFLCHFLGISNYVTVVTLDNVERGEKLLFKEYKKYDDWL